MSTKKIHVLTCSTVLTTQHFLLHATRLHTIFNPNIDCLVKSHQRVLLNTLRRLVSSHQSAGRIQFIEALRATGKAAEQTAAAHTPPPNKAPIVFIITL